MRIPIRIQLGLVVLLCALVPLAVLAIAVVSSYGIESQQAHIACVNILLTCPVDQQP